MSPIQLPPSELEDRAFSITLSHALDAPKRISLRPSSFHSRKGFEDDASKPLEEKDMEPFVEQGKLQAPGNIELVVELPRSQTPPNVSSQTQPNIPTHPVPSMQAAFAESLSEVTNGGAEAKPKLRELDARGRRDQLLDQDKNEEPIDAGWRYRPGQKQHEVLKLVSQITFGVYLLLNGIANDNAQVTNILQGHIDEVDEFLEVALEDLAHSLQDMTERIDFLKLPMTNMKMFEELLEDRAYRAEILEGNEKIEHILARTNIALKQWDNDVDVGLKCISCFKDWLIGIKNGSWRRERPDLAEVYDAMRGNADGWLSAFDDMHSRIQEMNGLVARLMMIVSEMEQKAGEVSRKTWSMIPPFTSPRQGSMKSGWDTGSSGASSHIQSSRSSQKPNACTSIRSTYTSTILQPRLEDDDSLADFPLPGGTPLLPPTRFNKRTSVKPSFDPARLRVVPVEPAIQEVIVEKVDEEKEATLFILQPRTYTPQPPEVIPPTTARDSDQSYATNDEVQRDSGLGMHRQSSTRHRTSPKDSPPEDIMIPLQALDERRGSEPCGCSGYSGKSDPTPASLLSHSNSTGSQNRAASDGPDIGVYRQQYLPRVLSHADLRHSQRPPLGPSYNTDFPQYYQPVRASPHSPLQQRPHTASGSQASRQQSAYFPHHLRSQPSQRGGMNTLRPPTAAGCNARPCTPGANTMAGGKSLRKKKSALGWLKKAFTLDEEEKATFEHRRQMQEEQIYYKDKSPKFLDGRRLR